jgi:hypothetical protein
MNEHDWILDRFYLRHPHLEPGGETPSLFEDGIDCE